MKTPQRGFKTLDDARGRGAAPPAAGPSGVGRGCAAAALRFAIAAAIVMALLGCAARELQLKMSGAEPLNQGELEQLFYAERTVEFSFSAGSAAVKYYPDGRQEIEWNNGKDSGSFRIENETFCSTWTNLRNGAESCCKVYRIGEKEYEFISSDGAYAGTMQVK